MAKRRHSKETRRSTLPQFPTFEAPDERPPPVTYADLSPAMPDAKVILEGEPDALVGHDELTDPRALKIEVPPAPVLASPLPSRGEGQGEGAERPQNETRTESPSAPSPHPDPLPARGEGAPVPPKQRTLNYLPLAVAVLALAAAGLSRLGGPKPLTEPPSTEAETKARDLAATHRRELSEYGWVDRDKRLIRMPIERAMQQIAADGKR